jgi:hypothetical protein
MVDFGNSVWSFATPQHSRGGRRTLFLSKNRRDECFGFSKKMKTWSETTVSEKMEIVKSMADMSPLMQFQYLCHLLKERERAPKDQLHDWNERINFVRMIHRTLCESTGNYPVQRYSYPSQEYCKEKDEPASKKKSEDGGFLPAIIGGTQFL